MVTLNLKPQSRNEYRPAIAAIAAIAVIYDRTVAAIRLNRLRLRACYNPSICNQPDFPSVSTISTVVAVVPLRKKIKQNINVAGFSGIELESAPIHSAPVRIENFRQ
ncbi:MAG: hypothetical protein WCK27_07555 [Verrucomicrobiota bacterium]